MKKLLVLMLAVMTLFVTACSTNTYVPREDYDDDEKDSIITSYYSSMEEFKASYPEEDINGILAECIFEQTHEIELTCFGFFETEDEAEEKALEYISKQ